MHNRLQNDAVSDTTVADSSSAVKFMINQLYFKNKISVLEEMIGLMLPV